MEPSNIQPGDVSLVSSSTAATVGQQSGSRKHARWNRAKRQTFIATCETAIVEGHRIGRCFTKHGWELAMALFNSVSGHSWTKQQLLNHWDAMRRQHKPLSELLKGRIVASEEWQMRNAIFSAHMLLNCVLHKQKPLHSALTKNKEYKDFKDRDVSDIYIRYSLLLGDSYSSEKYAITVIKLCRTGFKCFEDSAPEDHRDVILVEGEGSGSSDKGDGNGSKSMSISRPKSGDKRKSSTSKQRGKKKHVSTRKLSFSIDRANSVDEVVTAKINSIIDPTDNARAACEEELLSTGWL
ncbi:uncharacterized protein LOC111390790 [Olea europaea var. sylvestris]|uniref:uncharacterized protein LOC111390790 n=1 Tax=Olea europaea var. sylvestris TaxID=158386 RepID=UPI000C1CFD47|nr:uncharacterized protein LOC111390790 [Olea europaea var. sylvestris]